MVEQINRSLSLGRDGFIMKKGRKLTDVQKLNEEFRQIMMTGRQGSKQRWSVQERSRERRLTVKPMSKRTMKYSKQHCTTVTKQQFLQALQIVQHVPWVGWAAGWVGRIPGAPPASHTHTQRANQTCIEITHHEL